MGVIENRPLPAYAGGGHEGKEGRREGWREGHVRRDIFREEVGEVVQASVWWLWLLLPKVCELDGISTPAVQIGGDEAGREGGGEGQLLALFVLGGVLGGRKGKREGGILA